MARSNNKEYDCLLMYDYLSEDDDLSIRVAECTDERLRQWGYTKNHHFEKDNIPGRSVFDELYRVVDTSQFILLLLTRGFLQNCWIRYCQIAALKKAIDESIRPDQIASHRVIPILINITENEVPQELGPLTYIRFRDDWERDGPEWQKLKRALDGHPVQETIARGIGDVRPSATLNHMSQQLPESCSNQTVQNEIRATPGSNLLHNSNVASHCNNPAAAAASRNPIFQTTENTLISSATSDLMDSFESSQLFSSGGRDLRTSSSLPNTSQTNNRSTPLNYSGQPPHQRESTALTEEEEDHVTLSGFGSLNNESANNQLGQRTVIPRLSEAAQPITHRSSVRSAALTEEEEDHVTLSGFGSLNNESANNQLGQRTVIPRLSEAAQPITHRSSVRSAALTEEEEDHVTLSGFGSLNNESANNQLGQRTVIPRLSEAAQPITHRSSVRSGSRDPDIQEDASRISGTLDLQSRDVEPDAQESIVQPSTAGPRNVPPSQTDSVSDSSISLLNGLEEELLNFNSLMEGSTSSAFSFPSSEIFNSADINRDEPDTGVNQSPGGPVTESQPSFLSQAFRFTLHALFHPDKVYYPL